MRNATRIAIGIKRWASDYQVQALVQRADSGEIELLEAETYTIREEAVDAAKAIATMLEEEDHEVYRFWD